MKDSIKILILDFVSTYVQLILDKIREAKLKLFYLWVGSEEEYRKDIIEFKPDIIFADYILLKYNVLESVNLASELRPSNAFIIVKGEVNDDVAIEFVKGNK